MTTYSRLMLDPVPLVVEPRTDRYGVELGWWDRDCEKGYRSAATARVPELPQRMRVNLDTVLPHPMTARPAMPESQKLNLAYLLGVLEHPMVMSGEASVDLGPSAIVSIWAAARFASAPQVLLDLARSRHLPVRKVLAASAGLPGPIAAILAQDPNPVVRAAIANNNGIAAEWQVFAALNG